MSSATTPAKTSLSTREVEAFGDCIDCARTHCLPAGQARAYALGMMDEFERLQRLDYLVCEDDADPRFSFARLFAGRGNMFGVLECVDAEGATVILRAFSSLSGGARLIDGWVPPVLSQDVYDNVILPAQREIKSLTTDKNRLEAAGADTAATEARRRGVSRVLWERMCSEYELQNFRGEVRTLKDAALPGAPITGGMGECCAPKLLTFAARSGLRPVGIAEFYWNGRASQAPDPERAESQAGSKREVRNESRVSGQFYPSCEARCQPILGFMLCGLDT